MDYRKLKKLDIAKRRLLHDDISVVVLFLDQELMDGGRCNHLSLNAYGASTSQPDKGKGKASTSKQHADGDSSSNTDRARSRILPLIGEASTSQTPTAITKSKTWPGFSRRRHET